MIEISERTLARLRDHVARRSLHGTQISVAAVVEWVIVSFLDAEGRRSKKR